MPPSPECIALPAPAKVNLTLDVLARRPDGYHELETIMHQVDLCDFVEVSLGGEGVRVEVDHPGVPGGEANLAWQAARALMEAAGVTQGVRVSIAKRIPVAAGLAGGSTDAAAVLKGLNRLLGCDFDLPRLCAIGATIGSDVPFCIAGGTALARGRGERLEPLATRLTLHLVLVTPPVQVSTREVYAHLQLDAIRRRPDRGAVARGLATGDLAAVCAGMENVLEPVTTALCPQVAEIAERLRREGALRAMMSGSGPTVMGVFAEAGEAQRACAIMKQYCHAAFAVKSWGEDGGLACLKPS